jgi:hypothetical protein
MQAGFEATARFYARDPWAGWAVAQRRAQEYAQSDAEKEQRRAEQYEVSGALREQAVHPPVGGTAKMEPPPTGASSLERFHNKLQAARAEHPSPGDHEREWIETVLAFIREHPGMTWEKACEELGISWQMGPSRLDSSGHVIMADADGIRQTAPEPAFWQQHSGERHEHARGSEERVQHYCNMGIPEDQARGLADEEASQRGQRVDYQRSFSDAERRRKFDMPGMRCTGLVKTRLADGGCIVHPTY